MTQKEAKLIYARLVLDHRRWLLESALKVNDAVEGGVSELAIREARLAVAEAERDVALLELEGG